MRHQSPRLRRSAAAHFRHPPVAAGSFTVPSYVLSALPAGTGSSSLFNTSSYQTFTATGLDSGFALGGATVSVNSTYN
jgi:hypothetical protein